MRAQLMAALVVAVALAGCADEAAPEAEPEVFQELEASDKTGVIRGVVVDETITPIAGAKIKASPGDLETVTDEDGAFGFSDVEPGIYFITASAPWHTKSQTSTEVVAGEKKPTALRIALATIPKPVPAIQELQYQFSTAASGWVTGVGGIVFFDPTGEGHFSTGHDIAANTTWIQSELVWTENQPLANTFRLYSSLAIKDGDGLGGKNVRGKSPLLHVYDNETITSSKPLRAGYTVYVSDSDEVPAGIAVWQQLTMYTHAFQNFLPDDGWLFTQDGAHPVPDEPAP